MKLSRWGFFKKQAESDGDDAELENCWGIGEVGGGGLDF